MHSKLTLIVDGNWLLISRMSVMNNRYQDDKTLCEDLKLTMVRSIGRVLKNFPDIDNILFVTDGGSWRNTVERPEHLKVDNIEYKGNRERDDSIIDWDLLFKSYNDFSVELASTGINVYHEFGIEGDDWAWYFSDKLINDNTNVILWTQDQDWQQLVRTNENGGFIVWWNDKKGVYKEKKDINEDFNFFFNPYYNENISLLNNVIKNCNDIHEIVPNNIVIDKIIRGDKGDNILPCISRRSSNGTKLFRAKESEINFNLDIENEEEIEKYFKNLLNSKSFLGKCTQNIKNIMSHFEYNKQLVHLCRKSYPENYIAIMDKYDIPENNKDLSIIENKLNSRKNEIKDILDII